MFLYPKRKHFVLSQRNSPNLTTPILNRAKNVRGRNATRSRTTRSYVRMYVHTYISDRRCVTDGLRGIESADISGRIKFIARLTTNRNLHTWLATTEEKRLSSEGDFSLSLSLSLSLSSKYPLAECVVQCT